MHDEHSHISCSTYSVNCSKFPYCHFKYQKCSNYFPLKVKVKHIRLLKRAKEAVSTLGRILLSVLSRPSCPGGRVRCLCAGQFVTQGHQVLSADRDLHVCSGLLLFLSFVAGAGLGAKKRAGLNLYIIYVPFQEKKLKFCTSGRS